MKFVLDTSVTMRWLFGDGSKDDREYARSVLEELKLATAVVPVTWALEVANVIVRAESRNGLERDRSNKFIVMLGSNDIRVDENTFDQALTGTLSLARKYKLSSYDASYLELAIRLDLPLASLDDGLLKAARKAGVRNAV